MFCQERSKGQTTAALAGSLDPVIGKIICAAPMPTRTSYFDAMSNNKGSNDESATVGEGDLDCDEASSTAFFNLPDLLTIWECLLMYPTQFEIAEGVSISGWSCGHCPRPARGAPVARNLGPNYTPPDHRSISGRLMNSLFTTGFKDLMRTLLQEADIFGKSIFGGGATIKSVPLINVLAASLSNPFALLNIVDCTSHLAEGGKNDAPYIAEMVLPLIKRMDESMDTHRKKCPGVVDLVIFDCVSNVEKAGKLLAINHPCITALHGAEHVASLFFRDVYTNMSTLCFSRYHHCILSLVVILAGALFYGTVTFQKKN